MPQMNTPTILHSTGDTIASAPTTPTMLLAAVSDRDYSFHLLKVMNLDAQRAICVALAANAGDCGSERSPWHWIRPNDDLLVAVENGPASAVFVKSVADSPAAVSAHQSNGIIT